jgi:glycosyltransferase involved in cell wall biosynthesis
MAHARPVVATSVGGTPEVVVDGETGLLVPPRDPDALAKAVRRLVDDPELARRMGRAGYARVREKFSVEAMTARVLEVWDEVVGGR